MKSHRFLLIGIGAAIGLFGLMSAVNYARADASGQYWRQVPPPGPGGPRRPGGPGGPDGPGRPGGGPGMMGPRMMDHLGLSDTQREQIRALMDQSRTDSQQFQEQMKQVHDGIRLLVEGKLFDEQAARTLTKQHGEIESELAFIRVRTDAGIFRLLTDEQKTKLEEMRHQPPPPPPPPPGEDQQERPRP